MNGCEETSPESLDQSATDSPVSLQGHPPSEPVPGSGGLLSGIVLGVAWGAFLWLVLVALILALVG